MAQTDRQTDKSTRWAFTAYEPQYGLLDNIPEIVKSWGWQDEVCPETQRKHRQGYIQTFRQVRFTQLQKSLPGIHLEVAKNWAKLLNYCKKQETRDENGNQVHVDNANVPMTMAQALLALCPFARGDDIHDEIAKGELSVDKVYDNEYWACVCKVIEDNENAIGLYTNNQMRTAWRQTRHVWITKWKRSQLAESVDGESVDDESVEKMLGNGIDGTSSSSCG